MPPYVEEPEERNPATSGFSDRSAQARWQRITEIVATAFEMDASLRPAYVLEQCQSEEAFYSSRRAGTQQAWRISIGGGEPQQITKNSAFSLRASPDGKYLYFMPPAPENAIYQLDLRTGKQTRVVAGVKERSFSVTRRGVYYVVTVNTYIDLLHLWDLRTHVDSILARIRRREAGDLSVSQDDRSALIVKDDHAGPDLMLVKDFY